MANRPDSLRVEHREGVDWLTLDRPAQLNALDRQLVAELAAYFESVGRSTATRVVVLRGAGRAFCAGVDLRELQEADALSLQSLWQQQRQISGLIPVMRRIPQPIVSLVHGAACGGGFALALASDIRLAGRSARMNAAFSRIGLSGCDVGVSYLLPRLAGASAAAELLLTGDFIDAQRALALGLVSRVVEDEDLQAAAEPIIASMLRASPLGLQMTKEVLRIAIDAPSLEAAIALEDRTQVLCAATGVLADAVGAFAAGERLSAGRSADVAAGGRRGNSEGKEQR